MPCHQPMGHKTHPKAMGRMGMGQSCGKVTMVPIEENKIRKGGSQEVRGGVTGNEGICL